MPAFFTSNPNGQAGEGIINVPEIICENTPQFAIYRASDGLCLSPEGWQNAEIFHTASSWDNDSKNLRIAVDSNIVNHLDALDTYKFILKHGDETPKTLSLVIEDIVYSSLNGGQGIVDNTQTHEPEPEIIPEPEPEPETIPEPVEITPPLEMQEAEKKAPIAIIIASILLLLLLGAGIWWFLTHNMQAEENLSPNIENAENNKEEAENQEQNTPANEEKPSDTNEVKPDNTAVETPVEDAQNQDAPSQEQDAQSQEQDAAKNSEDAAKQNLPDTQTPSPMQQVREFLRQNSAGQEALTLATKLKQELDTNPSAENMDALFLVLEDAAQKDVPKAMLEVAKYYDPSNQAPKGSIIPDANEAYAWYLKAKNAGETEADASLESLKTWAEAEANKGNITAIDLLKHWK